MLLAMSVPGNINQENNDNESGESVRIFMKTIALCYAVDWWISTFVQSVNQQKIAHSNKRRRELQDLFIALDMEEEMLKKVQRKEKNVMKLIKEQEHLSQVAAATKVCDYTCILNLNMHILTQKMHL